MTSAVGNPSFTFRLERVRSLRERAEEQAREELARGLSHRMRGEALLHEAQAATQAAREHTRGAAGQGATASDLMAAQVYLERKERDGHAAELDLDRRDAEVEARRVALAAAAQEREVIERLKRRRQSEHAAETARVEQGELDEIALSVHRRGQVAA
jgi:flagellar protein FliJ